MGVGPTPGAMGGGTAAVGNKEFKSIVAAGCSGGLGIGEGVAVEKNGSSDGAPTRYSEAGVPCAFRGG